MDNKLVQRLQQILANQAQRGLLGTRFKIEKFPEQDIAEMLRMCYQSEVERRNMKYVSDEATLEKIGKAAKFLCGNGKFGLLLYGTVGSGKTTLAKAICNIIGILYNSDLSSEKREKKNMMFNS